MHTKHQLEKKNTHNTNIKFINCKMESLHNKDENTRHNISERR